jgi:glutathione S-transferase
MVNGYCAKDEAAVRRHHDDFMSGLQGLEVRLEGLTFLVGERATVADLVVFATVDMYLRFCGALAADVYVKCPHVVRHFMTVLHLPKVQAVLASVAGHGGQVPAKP